MPSHSPERIPPTATFDQVSRPVTRSMRLRSVPTIISWSTGKSASARKSTLFCAFA